MRCDFCRPFIVLVLVLVLVAVSLHAIDARAQSLEDPKLLVGLGAGIPVYPSEFPDGWNVGIDGLLAFSGNLSPALALSLGFEFTYFDIKQSEIEARTSGIIVPPGTEARVVDGGELTTIYIFFAATYFPVDEDVWRVQPYITLGGGYSRLQLTDVRFDLPDDQTFTLPIPNGTHDNFGAHALVGARINKFFVETGYDASLGGPNIGYVPIRIGIAVDADR
jgi:hypothetical protein